MKLLSNRWIRGILEIIKRALNIPENRVFFFYITGIGTYPFTENTN